MNGTIYLAMTVSASFHGKVIGAVGRICTFSELDGCTNVSGTTATRRLLRGMS